MESMALFAPLVLLSLFGQFVVNAAAVATGVFIWDRWLRRRA